MSAIEFNTHRWTCSTKDTQNLWTGKLQNQLIAIEWKNSWHIRFIPVEVVMNAFGEETNTTHPFINAERKRWSVFWMHFWLDYANSDTHTNIHTMVLREISIIKMQIRFVVFNANFTGSTTISGQCEHEHVRI